MAKITTRLCVLLSFTIMVIIHGQDEKGPVHHEATKNTTESVEGDKRPAEVEGDDELIHPDEPIQGMANQDQVLGPDQDHLGIHGEFEKGLFEDDFDPWDDVPELEEHDPFFNGRDDILDNGKYRDPQDVNNKQRHVLEENLDFDSEDHHLNKYDFSPSEGLSFVMKGKTKECFYEDIQTFDDHLRGAFITVAGDPKMDMYILNPKAEIIFSDQGKAESEYDIQIKELGVYEICFDNKRYADDKMLVFATETIESQHPIRKEHVSHLSKSASHLDVKLGKLESEQSLYHLRTTRHLQTENSTNARIAWYTSLECFAYCVVSFVQVVYIKHILEQPLVSRSWA